MGATPRLWMVMLVVGAVSGCPERSINRQPGPGGSSGGVASTDGASSGANTGSGSSSSGSMASGDSNASGPSTSSTSGAQASSASSAGPSSSRECRARLVGSTMVVCPDPLRVVDETNATSRFGVTGGVRLEHDVSTPGGRFEIRGGVRPVVKE